LSLEERKGGREGVGREVKLSERSLGGEREGNPDEQKGPTGVFKEKKKK